MKYILTILACFMLLACGDTNIGENTDVNVTAVISSINQGEDAMVRQGKYTKPSMCNTALFKNTTNKLYFTFTSCGNCIGSCTHCNGGRCHQVNLNDEWVYGHSVGDTVHFTYVHRERYFVIKNKSQCE